MDIPFLLSDTKIVTIVQGEEIEVNLSPSIGNINEDRTVDIWYIVFAAN